MKNNKKLAAPTPAPRKLLRARCMMLLLCTPALASAFCPNNGHKCGFGAVGKTHKDLTEDTLERLDEEYFGTDRLTKSMKNAIEEIWKADAEVDLNQTDGFWHFDGESFATGKRRVSELMNGVIRSLQAEDAVGAREQLGQALHTIQDFYSHTNYIESGHSGANRAIWSGDVPFAAVASPTDVTCEPCEVIDDPVTGQMFVDCRHNIVTTALTSGYYGGENEQAPHDQKCRHGGAFDHGPGPLGGINKDVLFETFAPHNFLHFQAASSAEQATEQFIRDIRAQLTERQLKLLLGVGPTLAFVIDTTGSMGSVISQVRAQAIQIVDQRVGTSQEPLRYVLSPFNDPGVGPLTIADDPDDFKDAINTLRASGGGDCPELAMQGQLAALYASDEGVDVFTFTDADAKDAGRAGEVSSLAASKDAKVFQLLNGACRYGNSVAGANDQASTASFADVTPTVWGPLVDPAYRRIAADSGGQLFLLGTSEIGTVTRLVDAAARANVVDLLSVADRLVSGSRDYSLPVDSSLERVTFSLSGFTGLELRRPDGGVVAAGDPGVSEIALSTGRIVVIERPASGLWHASVRGDGAYSLSVLGDSTVSLDRFDFVVEAGRPAHQGYFDVPGFPVIGALGTVSAELSGDIASAGFELHSKDGGTLQVLDMHRETDGDPNEFFGDVVAPATPFLVQVNGTLSNGEAFQRVLATQIAPQPVQVVAPAPQLLAPGLTTHYVFVVSNVGRARDFRFSVDDSHGFARLSTRNGFHLDTGATIEIPVDLVVPASVEQELTDTLTATVQATDDSDVRNFAVLRSRLQVATVDCSAAVALPGLVWPPNGNFVPVEIDGVTSSDGGDVQLQVDAVMQNEPTDGVGDGATCPDARGIGTAVAEVRSERSGAAGGRVYSILFSASNAVGSTCSARVDVCVPHDKNSRCAPPVNMVDSTVCH